MSIFDAVKIIFEELISKSQDAYEKRSKPAPDKFSMGSWVVTSFGSQDKICLLVLVSGRVFAQTQTIEQKKGLQKPGMFPAWMRSIGQSLEYSPTGCAPLANPWNIPRLATFHWPIPGIFPAWLRSIGQSLVHSLLGCTP